MNVASEETREIVKRCSELYGNIERTAEKIVPPSIDGQQVTELDSPTELNRADIDEVSFSLLGSDAKFISELIEPEDKFSSAGLRPAFWAMTHVDNLQDLEAVAGFNPISAYSSIRTILPTEWGTVGNTRWQYSTLGSFVDNDSSLGNRVYNTFVTGMESYACVELTGASAQFIYQGLGAGNDPLLQRQTAGKVLKVNMLARSKSSLIDLEAYGENYGDKGEEASLCAA